MDRIEEQVETGLEVAVIGMVGKFPGAKHIHEFWNNLKEGVESIQFFFDNELEGNGMGSEAINNPNFVKTNGGALEGIEYFDAAFFGYTPMEAEQMAPQVRIFHECLWEALEDAGYHAEMVNGLIGLYAGASPTYNWEFLCFMAADSMGLNPLVSQYLKNRDFMSTLISYKLNLKGPVFSMHTACSTSLVALHLACQGLITGDCDMALAGGVALNLSERKGYLYQEGMILSPDGHCRAFDANANGTVSGEGAGLVLLKRLEDALSDRDHIYAVIKGSAVNNDGSRKVGYTAPSIEGQMEVIRKAHRMAEVDPKDIGYIETHGTGTSLGDVTEMEALKLAFNTDKRHFCALGAVKTNIGHLDTAAGVAAIIKTVLAIKNHLIPPTVHFEAPNPRIDLENSPFYIIKELKQWNNNGRPLRAGVSSFGIGGTNAHVVLEEAPQRRKSDTVRRPYQLILISTQTQSALDNMSQNLAAYLKNNPGIDLADLAYTLQVGRKPWQYRRKLVCSTVPEARQGLTTLDPRKVKTHRLKPGSEKKSFVFMFPGLGTQYVNMGRELYQTEPRFLQEMDRCFAILEPLLDDDIKEILYPGISVSKLSKVSKVSEAARESEANSERIDDFEIAQLVTFIFEYALARLLMAWGIQPRALIGYSFGEYAAACLSGVFTLEDALKLLVLRGKLIRELPPGKMLNVPLPTREVRPLLNDECCIGIDNGSSCVVSGSLAAVNALEKQLKQEKVMCMPLDSAHGIHSIMMDPILARFEEQISAISWHKPQIPFISTVSGDWIIPQHAASPAYWVRQLRETVQFSQGMEKLLKEDEPDSIFLEVGPGRELSALVNREKDETPGHQVVHLVRPHNVKEEIPDAYYLLDKIGLLWLYGVSPDWEKYYEGESRYRVSLPTYPFERQRFWKLVQDYQAGKFLVPTRTQGAANSAKLVDWFYLPTWKRQNNVNINTNDKIKTPGMDLCWLVFMDDCGLGNRLTEELQKHNRQPIIFVKKGLEFEKQNPFQYTLQPKQYHHYQSLLEELKSAGLSPERILHLWGVTADHDDQAGNPANRVRPVELIEAAIDLGFYSLLYLAKALGSVAFSTEKIEIDVVTNHMQEVSGEESLSPGKAAVLGPCRVIPQEYPHLTCKSIDITHWQTPHFIPQLLQEITNWTGDRVIAFRGNRRWIQTFEPVRLEGEDTQESPLLRKQGVYLIIGGLGHIGSTLAQYLLKRVNARVILTGRSQLPPRETWGQLMILGSEEDKIYRDIQRLQQLQTLGGDVFYCSADVSQLQQMKEVIRQGEEQFGPINGVIHSAGIIAGETFNSITELTRDQCQNQFQAKLQGLLVLEELLQEKHLDFCLVISSISTVLGGLGFTAYAAANHFMDAFANRCSQKRQEPWIIVDWDGTNEEDTEKAFHCILSSNTLEQIVFSVGGDLEGRISRWVKLEGLGKSKDDKGEEEDFTPLYSRPELSNPYVAPRNAPEQQLADIWQRFFGIDKIGITDDLYDLGGDSLKAINIISIIHKELNVVLPIREFFNNSTIEGVVKYLGEAEQEEYISITPAEKKEYYTLSPAQKRLYILQQLEKTSTVYNSPQVYEMGHRVEGEHLERVMQQLMERHEILRTSIRLVKVEPVQVVHDTASLDLSVKIHDLSQPGDRQVEMTIRDFVRPFDLSRAPFLRLELVKLEESRYLMLFDIHHIVTDGVSHEIFTGEFIAIYTGQELSPLAVQYKDFSEWQKKPRQQAALAKQEAYWLEQFQTANEIPGLVLPYDYPRPRLQSFEGSRTAFELAEEETRALKKIAAQQGVTLYMTLMTIFNLLLFKLSNQEDIVVGTPVVGRRHKDLENVMGVFINTLPIRSCPADYKTIQSFLQETRESTLQTFDNQDYPFEDLVEKLAVKRDTGRNPMFDVLFVLQISQAQPATQEPGQGQAPGAQLKPYGYDSRISRLDLLLEAAESGEGLSLVFEYCTRLFKPKTLRRFIHYFKKITAVVIDDTQQEIANIDILSEEEKHQLLEDFNRTQVEYPADNTIHGWFSRQVEKTPHYIALKGKSAGRRVHSAITYRELNEKSNQLARLLRGKDVNPAAIAAVLLEQSIDMVIGIMAILKAGAAYLPIDPQYSPERINYILKDSCSTLLVTQSDFIPAAPGTCPIIDLDDNDLYKGETGNLESLNQSNHPAYVIYTSGSTGRPKGTLVEHRSLNNLCHWHQRNFSITPEDRATKYAGTGFDASVWEIFPYLVAGASIYLIPGEIKLDISKLNNYFEENNITITFLPTQICELFMALTNTSLRILLTGGDKLKSYIKRDYTLVNNYGPTENTVVTTSFVLDGDYDNIPIGKPIDNTKLYVVDKNLHPQPTGVPGELCISGSSLSRGYLNRPELTAEKFDHDLWDMQSCNHASMQYHSTSPHYPIYFTGDLTRWMPDGNIEFLGRIDHQVKVRGFRIEPGEIEQQLLKHKQIKEAVVLAREEINGNSPGDKNRDKYLCAYIVTEKDPAVSLAVNQLKEFLIQQLPDYMVPDYFVSMEKIPLTPNGKIDRKAFPPPLADDSRPALDVEYVAPKTGKEKIIAKSWKQVLKLEKIGIHDNFFDIGGNSLKLIQVNNKLNEAFNRDIPMVKMFEYPTIQTFLTYLDREQNEGDWANKEVEQLDIKHDHAVSILEETLQVISEE